MKPNDTMSVLASSPVKTQCDVIEEIKKLGFKDPDIIVWNDSWECRYRIIVTDLDKSTTLHVSYEKIEKDRRLEK